MMNLKFIIINAFLISHILVSAQTEELISGDVLSHFQSTKQWHLVDDVVLNEADPKQFLSQPAKSGDILLNSNEKVRRLPYLLTQKSYGDFEISLEYMIPKGANAGVYVMGRYEVQIFDSYGAKDLKFSDMGAIYQRYHEKKNLKSGQKAGGYEGVPPLVNAAKAPGEWQRLDIKFRAPRFDSNGLKIKNARFVSVYLNEQLVQQNIEVTGPTRSNPLKGEAAIGPVSIQGDHAAVAIRSFIVKALNK